MTTIAYRDGILAADSRTTRGEVLLPGAQKKLFRLPDGSIAGTTGAIAQGLRYIDWLANPGIAPAPSLDGTVIHVMLDGTVRYTFGAGWITMDGLFEAWGSGLPAALGALHAGASALDAVKIAGLVDVYTGGPYDFMSIAPAKLSTGVIAQLRDFTVD